MKAEPGAAAGPAGAPQGGEDDDGDEGAGPAEGGERREGEEAWTLGDAEQYGAAARLAADRCAAQAFGSCYSALATRG